MCVSGRFFFSCFLFEGCWDGCAVQLSRVVGEAEILAEVWSVLQIPKGDAESCFSWVVKAAPSLTNTFSP